MREKLNCIMVIDDDEPTNFISLIFIEEANCTRHLEIIDGGLKALNYLKNIGISEDGKDFIQPDLIFLDINMPGMNGWEFLDEYKKLRHNHPVKPVIIVLSTSFNPDDKKRAENDPDVAGFENKPLTTAMILRIINKYFSRGSVLTSRKTGRE